MTKYRKDVLTALLSFSFVIILNFILPRILPGDPIAYLTGFAEEDMTVKQYEYYEDALHIKAPVPEQFFFYLKSLADGSLGYSYKKEATVRSLIFNRLGHTLQITLTSVCFTSIIALMLGLSSGLSKGSRFDRAFTTSSVILNTVPTFMIGIILLLFFAFRKKWFPYANLSSMGVRKGTLAFIIDRSWHLFLPVLTLVLAQLPSRFLLVRNLAANISEEKYILYAKTRGLSRRTIKYHYIFPNIAAPFINIVGMSVGSALGGALVIENLFSINGMGTLLTEAVYSLDYPLIQGILFVSTAFMTLSIILADGLCLLVNPKIRKKERKR